MQLGSAPSVPLQAAKSADTVPSGMGLLRLDSNYDLSAKGSDGNERILTPRIARLTADTTRNSTTQTAITDLSWSLDAGLFLFRFVIGWTATATTYGATLALTGPTLTSLHCWRTMHTTVSSASTAYATSVTKSATAASTEEFAMMEGLLNISAAGTFGIIAGSSVASSIVTYKANSWGLITSA